MANTSIQNIKNKVAAAGGLQRENRFLVTIESAYWTRVATPNPNIDDTVNGGKKSYIADSVILPNITMTTQADGLAGPGLGRTMPKGLSYRNGVMVTFPIFGDLIFLNGINAWMKSMYYENNTVPKVWVTNYYENQRENKLYIELLDLNGNISGIYTFKEVFPVEIAPIELSAQKMNSYASVMVRFAFREYSFALS